MRRYGWLFAGLLLIGGVIAAVLSRPDDVVAPSALPPLPVAAPRVIGTWAPSAPTTNEAELVVRVTEHGQPVSGAEVRANGKEPSLTDASGLVTLRLPLGAVQLTATAHGVITRGAANLSSLLGAARVELSLDAQGMIDVVVTDAKTQQPLKGALVEVHLSPNDPRRVIAAIETDVQGKAKIEGLVPMEYLLSVTRPGYINSSCAFIKVGESREVELLPHEPSSGRVLMPDGKPAVGATVVSINGGWEEFATATTGRDGTFTLPFVNQGGRLCAQLGELVITDSVEVASTTGMVLATPTRFRGSVADEDGVPVEGVRVRAEQGSLEVIATTDADGGFTINSLCDDLTFATFERAGFITESELLTLDEPNDIVLSSPRAVRGVVVDDEDRPVGGAVVSLNDPEMVTLTDAQGRFGFEGVKRVVTLMATEGERGGSAQTMLERGQLVEVTISVGPVLYKVPVEVMDDGKLAEGTWELTAKRIGGRAWEEKTSWNAERLVVDVIYPQSFSLPVGSFKVSAKNEWGHGETELRVTGTAPQEPLRIHVVENPPPPLPPERSLWVRVIDSHGTPVPDAGIDCESVLARTDQSGRGRCALRSENLPHAVRARVGGGIAAARPKDWNEELLLQLSDGMSVRGTVIGELHAPGFISVNSKEEQAQAAFTPPEFVLPELPAVRTILCVWSENTERGCTVAEPIPSGELEVTIPLGAPTQVSFTVSDARGLPVAQPVLYVDRHSTSPPVDGGVVMLSLSPGKHLLIVNVREGPERYEAILSVEPGRAQHLGRIELR